MPHHWGEGHAGLKNGSASLLWQDKRVRQSSSTVRPLQLPLVGPAQYIAKNNKSQEPPFFTLRTFCDNVAIGLGNMRFQQRCRN
jgi:hypothetical protein